MSRIVYYYQTFKNIDKLKKTPEIVDTIILASVHFGLDSVNNPYIHLNDYSPYNKIFSSVWKDMDFFTENNTEVLLLVGGAGGAFSTLFSDYDTYYDLLKKLINSKKCIKGIELDIEERVELDNVKKLLRDLKNDFGKNFILTMAPISYSMVYNSPGMGGFIYKDLFNSREGQLIDRFNVQAYGTFTFQTYKNIIDNGYPPNKIVLGMLWNCFNKENFNNALTTIKNIKILYPDMAGIDIWEYYKAPPSSNDPTIWAKKIREILQMYSPKKKFSIGILLN